MRIDRESTFIYNGIYLMETYALPYQTAVSRISLNHFHWHNALEIYLNFSTLQMLGLEAFWRMSEKYYAGNGVERRGSRCMGNWHCWTCRRKRRGCEYSGCIRGEFLIKKFSTDVFILPLNHHQSSVILFISTILIFMN